MGLPDQTALLAVLDELDLATYPRHREGESVYVGLDGVRRTFTGDAFPVPAGTAAEVDRHHRGAGPAGQGHGPARAVAAPRRRGARPDHVRGVAGAPDRRRGGARQHRALRRAGDAHQAHPRVLRPHRGPDGGQRRGLQQPRRRRLHPRPTRRRRAPGGAAAARRAARRRRTALDPGDRDRLGRRRRDRLRRRHHGHAPGTRCSPCRRPWSAGSPSPRPCPPRTSRCGSSSPSGWSSSCTSPTRPRSGATPGCPGTAFSPYALVHEAYDNTNEDVPDETRGTLVGFVSDERADELLALAPDERRRRVLESLRGYYGDEALHPVGYYESPWMHDEWTAGAYATSFATGSLTRFGPLDARGRRSAVLREQRHRRTRVPARRRRHPHGGGRGRADPRAPRPGPVPPQIPRGSPMTSTGTPTAVPSTGARRLVTELPGPRSRELAARKAAAVAAGVGTTMPVYAVRAHGGVVEDVDGNVLDRPRLGHRGHHRRLERAPGRRGRAGAGRGVHPHLLHGHALRGVRRGGRAAQRADPGRPRQADRALQLGRRGGRERRQDRPVPTPAGRRSSRSTTPTTAAPTSRWR